MSHITPLLLYLDRTSDWNIKELKEIIAQKPSSINEERIHTKHDWCNFYVNVSVTPLIKVLESEKCTVDIIKFLIDHGADINFEDHSPLMVALDHCADDKVIAMLLDNGAKVEANDDLCSPLCVALRSRRSKYVIQLLLDKGCSFHSCKKHASTIHCFCDSQRWGLNEDVMKLVFVPDEKVSTLDADGQSPMCLALLGGAGLNDITLLMQVGLSLNDCSKHPSPFHCLVGGPVYRQTLLEGDVVKSLLDAGAHFDTVVKNGSTLLHDILHHCEYENEAIRLLLDVPGVDVNSRNQDGENLLHCSVRNYFCTLSVLQLLLDKGAEVGNLDANGMTALDVAIATNAESQVLKFLLNKGSPINTQDLASSRPLNIALERRVQDDVVMTLLFAGARVGTTLNFGWMKKELDYYLSDREIYQDDISEVLDGIKCLIKCYILEESEFPIGKLTLDSIIRDELRSFAGECTLELGQMDSESIGHCRTLRQLISRKSPPRTVAASCCMLEGKDFDFNRLLEALSGTNAFPLYFDFISASVGKESMEKGLREVPVYTVIECPDSPRTGKKVTLNYDVVRKIAGLLSDAEVMKLILAFNKPKNLGDIVSMAVKNRML